MNNTRSVSGKLDKKIWKMVLCNKDKCQVVPWRSTSWYIYHVFINQSIYFNPLATRTIQNNWRKIRNEQQE